MAADTPNAKALQFEIRNLKFEKKKEQSCLQCGFEMGNIAGSKEAICTNCGWKDPCCE